jgi:flagellar biosynthetic protein FlhB
MAEEEDDAQKTEDPSEKKLSKARQKGQVVMSQEVKSWAIILGGAMGLVFMAPGMMRDVTRTGAPFVEFAHDINLDFENIRWLMVKVLLELGWIMAPLVGLLVALALAASLAQTGLIFAPEKIKPQGSKISLGKGMKKIFSTRSVVEFLKGIIKLSIVTVVALGLALPLLDNVTLLPSMPISATLDKIQAIAIQLTVGTLAVMTAVAYFDFLYQRHMHMKQMRMSKQEVKDEHKQAEGDPHVKARIRKLRTERAQQRMMAAVPKADVVITNPTHYAVALKYEMEDMQAPRLVAKGMDSLALRIRELAEENDIPVVENPPLARALYAVVELEEEIPEEHYKAVAEIIGYVMGLKGNRPTH